MEYIAQSVSHVRVSLGVAMSESCSRGSRKGFFWVSDCGLLVRSSREGKKPKEHWGVSLISCFHESSTLMT